jgi:hypothetical protein
MTLFQRAQYNWLAAFLSRQYRERIPRPVVDGFVERMATALQETNPRFDRSRFVAASKSEESK